MAIEDTFGYRFVRTSLVMLNCIVLLRLLSLLLQYSHVFEPTFVLFILLIGSNFMIAIIGAVREHRVSVILTGSITLIMFLSLIFTAKENKGVNIFLLILLAISVQSLIFSEMLKERQTLLAQRRGLSYFGTLGSVAASRNGNSANSSTNGHLAAVVVYQTPGSTRPGALFMVDPEIGSELAKDPPPSYFASNSHHPPPKYEDAIKLNAGDLSLPAVPTVSGSVSTVSQLPAAPAATTSSSTTNSASQALPILPPSYSADQLQTTTNNSSNDSESPVPQVPTSASTSNLQH